MLTAIINGPDGEQVSEVGDPSVILGRHGTLRLNDRRVSKRHARLQSDGDEWYVEDMGSKNGTFINGVRVVRPCRIKEGDKLRLGSTQLTISKLSQPERLEAPRMEAPEPELALPTAPTPPTIPPLAPALAFVPTSAPSPAPAAAAPVSAATEADDELGFLTLSASDLLEPIEWTAPELDDAGSSVVLEEPPPTIEETAPPTQEVAPAEVPAAIDADVVSAEAEVEPLEATAAVPVEAVVAPTEENAAPVTADTLVPELVSAPVDEEPATASPEEDVAPLDALVAAPIESERASAAPEAIDPSLPSSLPSSLTLSSDDVATDEAAYGAESAPTLEPELPPSIETTSDIALTDVAPEAAEPAVPSVEQIEAPRALDEEPATPPDVAPEEPRSELPAPMVKQDAPPADDDESLAAFMNVLPAQRRAKQQQLTRMPDETILSIRPFARHDEPSLPEQPWRRRMPYVMLSLVLLAVLANLALLAIFRRDARRDAAALQNAIEKQDQATAELILQEVREELRSPSAQHVQAWQALGDSVLAKQEALAEKLQSELAAERDAAAKQSATPAPVDEKATKAAEESRAAMLRELGEIKLALAELRKSSAAPAPVPAAPQDDAKPASATEGASAPPTPASTSQRNAEPTAAPVVVAGRKGVYQSFVIDASGTLQNSIPEAVAEVRRSIDAARTRGTVRILLLYQGRLIELPPAALAATSGVDPIDLGTADLAAAVKAALEDRPAVLNLLSDTLGGVTAVQGIIRQADMSGTSVNITQFFVRTHREQLKSLARDYHGTYGYVAPRGQ